MGEKLLKLKEEMLSITNNGLSGEEVEKVISALDESTDYVLHFTQDMHECARWLTNIKYEKKKFNVGTHKIEVKGQCIINHNVEFGRETYYEYEDVGNTLKNEEIRITNYMVDKKYVALFKRCETSDFSDNPINETVYNLYIYIPNTKEGE